MCVAAAAATASGALEPAGIKEEPVGKAQPTQADVDFAKISIREAFSLLNVRGAATLRIT